MNRHLMTPDRIVEIDPDVDVINVRADKDVIHYIVCCVGSSGGLQIIQEYRTKETVCFKLKAMRENHYKHMQQHVSFLSSRNEPLPKDGRRKPWPHIRKLNIMGSATFGDYYSGVTQIFREHIYEHINPTLHKGTTE